MKHTKGEWFAGKNPATKQILMKEGMDIIGTYDAALAFVSGDSPEECEANALLMAAAPEMLEALKVWENIYTNFINFPDLPIGTVAQIGNAIKKQRSIIKKATN